MRFVHPLLIREVPPNQPGAPERRSTETPVFTIADFEARLARGEFQGDQYPARTVRPVQGSGIRYWLRYTWKPILPTLNVISCNPSTATATTLDKTLLRTINQAAFWSFGSIYQANLSPVYLTDSALLEAWMFKRDEDNLGTLANVLSGNDLWLSWGSIPPNKSGDGFRPNWNARIAEALELVHAQRRTGRNLMVTRLLGPTAPGHPSPKSGHAYYHLPLRVQVKDR